MIIKRTLIKSLLLAQFYFAFSILVVRFASWHYPSVMKEKHSKTPTSLKTPQPQDDELA
jgi:hypothetical protein